MNYLYIVINHLALAIDDDLTRLLKRNLTSAFNTASIKINEKRKTE
jgi:hypothetical protein